MERNPQDLISRENFPHEIFDVDFSGKSIIQSTRAGTVGAAAATKADVIYVTSFVIARATVDKVLLDQPDIISIIAMGDQGANRADEDEQCGIYLRNLLEGREPGYRIGEKPYHDGRGYPEVF
ncbi:MAG: hypothetical protein CM1200mP15_02200 [Dehalococcoidia bacterium]|nr:MAG: hypothetical protein CM1200mP15_02200 [Dehalococcoidia bacterium]